MFSVTSRYHAIETARHVLPDGREVVYVRRRFLPAAPPASVLAEHTVTQGDRLDNVTAQYLSDPEQYWRLCDANPVMGDAARVMRPDDLVAEERIGSRLIIPLPDGAI